MTIPEEMRQDYEFIAVWQDNDCNDVCFCSGYLADVYGRTVFKTLAGAKIAISDNEDKAQYRNCTFTIKRREVSEYIEVYVQINNYHDQKELTERFANQDKTRQGAIEEIMECLDDK